MTEPWSVCPFTCRVTPPVEHLGVRQHYWYRWCRLDWIGYLQLREPSSITLSLIVFGSEHGVEAGFYRITREA